jgi:hypothetical protein
MTSVQSSAALTDTQTSHVISCHMSTVFFFFFSLSPLTTSLSDFIITMLWQRLPPLAVLRRVHSWELPADEGIGWYAGYGGWRD